MSKPSLAAKLRLGFYVLGALMVVEVTEYVIGTRVKRGAWPYLAILTLPGALPILYYFMHIKQLWHHEE
ncbi:MAG: hypothetical protein HY676_06140 [Chloroflexi bacterium]|nr:hypothetical protein [Chloroflexota bacterium]